MLKEAVLKCSAAESIMFDHRRTVQDKQTGSDIVLSDEQVELVNRLQKGQFGDVNFNEYQVGPGDAVPRLERWWPKDTCFCS